MTSLMRFAEDPDYLVTEHSELMMRKSLGPLHLERRAFFAGSEVMRLMPAEDVAILDALERAMRQPRAARALARIADSVEKTLHERLATKLAWRTVPLETYASLPDGIASSWVFVLRGGGSSGAERHPNSVQRVMSWRGNADLQTWDGDRWVSHPLSSDPAAAIHDRWLSIPTNVWHRPVMPGEDWTVVSFHTAADHELLEELPADDEHPDDGLLPRAPYAGRNAR